MPLELSAFEATMQTSAALQDEQIITFDDAYLIEMTHRINRLRELHAAMEDTSKPRRWIETLNIDTLR